MAAPIVPLDPGSAVLTIREAAEKFGSQDLWRWANVIETDLADFFREPPLISATELIIDCTDAARCWARVTGEPIGIQITVEEAERMRRIVLDMHRPVDTTWSN
ncbi:hypothetical protein [Mesorhizobium shangrilense]|uniref:Uncharacterized protein n=1 Tax=Mesorhizobium shangrilense TaxID=460060 RepID=A0ABV2DGS8_9HYPH